MLAAALSAGRCGAAAGAALARLPQRLPPGLRAAGRGAAEQLGGPVVGLGAGFPGAGAGGGCPAPWPARRRRFAGRAGAPAAALGDATRSPPGQGL